MFLSRKNSFVELSTSNPDWVDYIDDVCNTPPIAVVVDVPGLRRCLGKSFGSFMSDGDLSDGIIKLGNRVGKITNLLVVVEDGDTITRRVWTRTGATYITPTNNTPSEVALSMNVAKLLYKRQGEKFFLLLVTGDSTYLDLVKEINADGGTVLLTSPKGARIGDLRAYCPLLFSLEEVMHQEDEIDLENYNYRQFIKLLNSNERYLPFVGAQYFIERQMNRLGVTNTKTCRRIFQRAKDLGIIVVSTRPNKDAAMKEVSACRLDRDHELVKEVLVGDSEEYTEPTTDSADIAED